MQSTYWPAGHYTNPTAAAAAALISQKLPRQQMAVLQRMLNCNTSLLSSVSRRLSVCQHTRLTRGVTAAVSSSGSSSVAPASIPVLSRARHRRSQLVQRLKAAPAAADVEQLDAAAYATHALEGPMSWPARSHGAGEVTEADVGKDITVCGWVDRNRNLGGLGFLDIRDHTGLLQVCRCRCGCVQQSPPALPGQRVCVALSNSQHKELQDVSVRRMACSSNTQPLSASAGPLLRRLCLSPKPTLRPASWVLACALSGWWQSQGSCANARTPTARSRQVGAPAAGATRVGGWLMPHWAVQGGATAGGSSAAPSVAPDMQHTTSAILYSAGQTATTSPSDSKPGPSSPCPLHSHCCLLAALLCRCC